MFLLLAQGWIKRIVLQVYIIIILLFYSAFLPGGECQEENKEKEIHPLWDGESKQTSWFTHTAVVLYFGINWEVSSKWLA